MYVNVYMYIQIYIFIHYICDVDGKCWDMFAIKWLMIGLIGNQCKLIRNIVIIVLPLLLLMIAIMNMQNMQIKPSLISLLCKPKKLWGRTSTCWFQKIEGCSLNYEGRSPKCTRDHKGSVVSVWKSYSSGPWPTNLYLKRNLPISAPEISRCLCQSVFSMYIFGGNQVSCSPLFVSILPLVVMFQGQQCQQQRLCYHVTIPHLGLKWLVAHFSLGIWLSRAP